MNILQIAQAVTARFGLPQPSSLISNTDQTAVQVYALLNEEIAHLSRRTQWQQLAAQATFLTVATESQGVITILLPNLDYIINDTVWNRSLQVPVYGSLSPAVYAQNTAMVAQNPYNQYRIMGNNFLMYPAPPADQTIAVDYMTNLVGTSAVGNPLTAFAADTDSPLLDSEAIILGTLWRFKQQKGFDYADDLNKYEAIVSDLMTRNAPQVTLCLGSSNDFVGGVFVQAGSW